MTRAHMLTPCENCPYRLDAPRRLWDRKEFEHLLAMEDDPIGTTYSCHKQGDLAKDARGFCAGWALDQRERGVPSIALRIFLLQDPDSRRAFEAITDGDQARFPTVKAMCAANGVRRRR